MEKNKRIIVIAYVTCCVAMTAAGCSGNKDNNLNGLCKISKEQTEEQNAEYEQNEVNSEEREDDETAPDAPGDMNYHYYYLDVDDPVVQEHIADGDVWFMSRVFIKGLIGYTPESDISGMLESYSKDTEIIIKENPELFPSERLAEVKEFYLNIMMDIIRKRGENIDDYQKYFADEAMPEQIRNYLKTELEEDWLLLESFYLSDYAGNAEEIAWYSNSETIWEDEENGVTHRKTETDTAYCFEFLFYADYKTMNYGERDKAAALAINCELSKETGLIEEIGISKWYIAREDFETSRW
ncbi:MAG: hypothetical protein HDR11_12030 [Lachnospiraceae bacterium]|nr:hypothetical protein [Lachnospiraceae bacterium]MBD5512374.1 hypothetical protein [Lachnospiraceae bacterium]